jgi:hypothetical protein
MPPLHFRSLTLGSWHAAILAGVITAALALLPLSFNVISFFLNYFAAFPLYLIGLSCGMHRLALAALIALALFMITAGIQPGLIFAITTLVPAFLIVYRIHKGDPGGYVVSWITALSIVIFVGIVMILASQSVNVLDVLKSWFALFSEQIPVKSMNTRLIGLLPGISGISWIIMCLVNASLALRFAALRNLTPRPYPTPNDRQLYENWDIIFGFGLLLVLTNAPLFAFIGENIALISCAPIFLVGLSVVYAWLGQYENPKIWLIGIIFLSFLLVWPGIVIVLFGVLEPTLHLRQRWTHQ